MKWFDELKSALARRKIENAVKIITDAVPAAQATLFAPWPKVAGELTRFALIPENKATVDMILASLVTARDLAKELVETAQGDKELMAALREAQKGYEQYTKIHEKAGEKLAKELAPLFPKDDPKPKGSRVMH